MGKNLPTSAAESSGAHMTERLSARRKRSGTGDNRITIYEGRNRRLGEGKGKGLKGDANAKA